MGKDDVFERIELPQNIFTLKQVFTAIEPIVPIRTNLLGASTMVKFDEKSPKRLTRPITFA